MPFPPVEHQQVHWELLRAYVERGDEAAFARVVEGHVGMVFSSAMRQTRNRDLAQEVTHVVFIVLARKAASLRKDVILSAWLFKTTRFTALNVLKVKARRERHERKAAEMISDPTRVHSSWHRLSPMLDEAIARLGEKDRSAIVLRFFDRKSPAEVGREMGISEDAAAMRISRAVAKLRSYFKDRRVDLDAEALGAVILANAIVPAPQGLGASVTAGANLAMQAGAAGSVGAPIGGAVHRAMSNAAQSATETADAVIRAMFLARARAVAIVTAMVLAAAILLGLFVNGAIRPKLPPRDARPREATAELDRAAALRQVRAQSTDRSEPA